MQIIVATLAALGVIGSATVQDGLQALTDMPSAVEMTKSLPFGGPCDAREFPANACMDRLGALTISAQRVALIDYVADCAAWMAKYEGHHRLDARHDAGKLDLIALALGKKPTVYGEQWMMSWALDRSAFGFGLRYKERFPFQRSGDFTPAWPSKITDAKDFETLRARISSGYFDIPPEAVRTTVASADDVYSLLRTVAPPRVLADKAYAKDCLPEVTRAIKELSRLGRNTLRSGMSEYLEECCSFRKRHEAYQDFGEWDPSKLDYIALVSGSPQTILDDPSVLSGLRWDIRRSRFVLLPNARLFDHDNAARDPRQQMSDIDGFYRNLEERVTKGEFDF